MNARHKMIRVNIGAFTALFAVSFYRQFSLRYFPHDPCRTYILYAVYVVLLGLWIGYIVFHITQKNMQRCLSAQACVMLFTMTVRFVQDTFLVHSIPLMRESGLLTAATVLPVMLLGIYAALGLGQADDYRINIYWWLLMIPVGFFTALIVMDDRVHFERESGTVTDEDLAFCFRDMADQLRRHGMKVNLSWDTEETFGPEFSVFVFDELENILERESFSITQLDIIKRNGVMLYTVRENRFFGHINLLPRTAAKSGYHCEQTEKDGIRSVRITERTDLV